MKVIAFLLAVTAGIVAIIGGVPFAGLLALLAAVAVIVPVKKTGRSDS